MLTHLRIQRYKSLFDVSVDLEPLTVFIGPNGSGKSNICEALLVLSKILEKTRNFKIDEPLKLNLELLQNTVNSLPNPQPVANKFWRGETNEKLIFEYSDARNQGRSIKIPSQLVQPGVTLSQIGKVKVYDFFPTEIAKASPNEIQTSGEGIANALAKILFDQRDLFIELEERLTKLVPNISRISLNQDSNRVNLLRLVDRYSEHKIPASDVSDGTLRLLAFLAALYDVEQPSIICFEEPENGIHPWLLNKIMEILNQVAEKGVRGRPVQILITTHSPVLLNYVKPEQVRAVEMDAQGRTQVRALPTDSLRFQKAMDAYDGELGELWFTNLRLGRQFAWNSTKRERLRQRQRELPSDPASIANNQPEEALTYEESVLCCSFTADDSLCGGLYPPKANQRV